MKYRIISVRQQRLGARRGRLSARRSRQGLPVVFCSLPVRCTFSEKIDIDALFAVGELPEARANAPKGRSRKRQKKHALSSFFAMAIKGLAKKLTPKRQKISRLSFFAGVLCSAVCIALISAATVIIGLFGGYLAPYEELIVPSLVGQRYEDVESSIGEGYELLISYENSEEVAAGVVISQMPSAGVARKLYKNGSRCTLTLKVSAGRHFYAVEALAGSSERDALLRLRGAGVAVKAVYEYSDMYGEGTVIGSVPEEGHRLYDGEVLTLKVSLGKEIPTVTVPDLYGLGEIQAEAMLKARGLVLGSITYTASSMPAGKVIAQQFSPYSPIAQGSSVDITVSIGNGFSQKTVPDLYGLDAAEAEARLAEVGLVLGSIYTVSSGAPKGTVVAQTPIPDTPITSTITSVDIYISS